MMGMLKCCMAVAVLMLSKPLHANSLPDGLQWISNPNEPLFASQDAIFGGTFRTYIASFPQTFRIVGPDSNGRFRSWLLDSRPASVTRHPITNKWIPDIATHWAYGDDDKTVYFRINPSARWSDGKPITTDDYTFVLTLMRSKDIVAPWYNKHYTEQVEDIIKFDDHTFSVVSATKRNREELMIYANLQPRPAHFYKPKTDKNRDGVDDNFVRYYNFKAEPSAGPYYVDGVKKGKSITFKHVGKSWWGYTNRYYQHRYNVEKIRIKVIRDKDIARQHFEKGNMDSFWLDTPELWHEKSNTEAYKKGYIQKFWGYNQVPIGAGGMWINTSKPYLDNRDIRKGVSHAIDFDGMIQKVLRGDFLRKPNGVGIGQGEYTNSDITAPKFSPELAAKYFAMGGFEKIGEDGIRINSTGDRLSFAVTYSRPYHSPRIAYLKEQAKQAGLELTLNLIDGSSAFKYVLEKKHELSFHNMSSGEIPSYWQYFHSDNANKPQTNNFTNFSSDELDNLITAYRSEFDLEKKKAISRQIQQQVADAAIVIPGYMMTFAREAHWRWMKYPTPAMTRLTEFLFSSGTALDLGTYWIDPKLKKETKSAMKKGKVFKPVIVVDETYKL